MGTWCNYFRESKPLQSQGTSLVFRMLADLLAYHECLNAEDLTQWRSILGQEGLLTETSTDSHLNPLLLQLEIVLSLSLTTAIFLFLRPPCPFLYCCQLCLFLSGRLNQAIQIIRYSSTLHFVFYFAIDFGKQTNKQTHCWSKRRTLRTLSCQLMCFSGAYSFLAILFGFAGHK